MIIRKIPGRVLQLWLLMIFGLVGLVGTQASAREVEGIAAIVNDEVISIFDVDQRVDLFFVTSGIERSPQNIDNLRSQVLRSLIKEKLQLQEARDSKIDISEAEIDEALQQMAANSNRSIEDIETFLSANGVRIRTMREQIEAELAWNRFVRGRFGSQISIAEMEIDETMERAEQTINQERYNLSEILLLVNNPAEEKKLLGDAGELIKQLRNGVDFAAVARQFSAASSAAAGGNAGWVPVNQLDVNLLPSLSTMKQGEVSDPIRTSAGIYVVRLNGKQQSGRVDPMRNVFDLLVLGFDSQSETLNQSIETTRQNFKTCKAALADAQTNGAVTANRTGPIQLGQLSEELRVILMDLQPGQFSIPVKNEKTTDMLIVCDRKDDQGVEISRDAIENNIYSQRLSIMARRHLRELQHDSIVEYR